MKILFLFILIFHISHVNADEIYNLIKIPNLEIYEIQTANKLRYLYAKKPFTVGLEKNIKCYNSEKKILEDGLKKTAK